MLNVTKFNICMHHFGSENDGERSAPCAFDARGAVNRTSKQHCSIVNITCPKKMNDDVPDSNTQSQMHEPSHEATASAPSADVPTVPPLRGSVIHFSRTRNRFKIVPDGKMPHEAVFLTLKEMNSSCDGRCPVDETVSPHSW